MDTNQGAGDETAIDKEQHIPETQPPAHDPAAKKALSQTVLRDTLDATIFTNNAHTSPEHGCPKKRKAQTKTDKARNSKNKLVQNVLFHGNHITESLEESKEDEETEKTTVCFFDCTLQFPFLFYN